MHIVVCVKQVPDTNEVRIDPVKGTLIRDGVPSIMNPDDKAALEYALQLRDQDASTEVSVISMGPPQAEAVLRESMAMGADNAYLITDRAFGGADTWATSSTIAAAVSKLDYDLILCGRQAIDGDTAQVGPEIAEHLHIPNISYAAGIQKDGNDLVIKRQYDDGYHMVRVTMPCLVTALAESIQPRYMTPRGIMEAYEKEIPYWTRPDVPVEDENIGLTGSPTRVAKSFPKSVKAPGMKIEKGVDESVQFIIDKLQDKYLL
ncbi:electron transfer flavoprotein subunit beta [Peptoniphilaceae bacterium SGI.137]|nr:electron transfer flavoprotein subunit beta/FixA family protein [Peptoniphilaceae bacterium]